VTVTFGSGIYDVRDVAILRLDGRMAMVVGPCSTCGSVATGPAYWLRVGEIVFWAAETELRPVEG
jgi:hypothetical protein